LIADKLKFYTGLAMLAVFAVLLVLMFMPIFDGKNALQYLDDLYNSLAKGSSYFIPELQEDVSEWVGTPVDVILEMEIDEQAEQTALLYEEAGADVTISGVELGISGDLGLILESCLHDSDAMFHNDTETLEARYGYDAQQVMFNWWLSLEAMNVELKDVSKFDEAKIVDSVVKRGVEPAFNFFGIEAQSVSDSIGLLIFSLVFYVIYTIWYGFSLMFMVEGLGFKIRQMLPFRFVARVKLT